MRLLIMAALAPYSDKEVECILREAPNSGRRTTGLCPNYPLSPRTCQLSFKLLLETGMRAGDAIRFDPSALIKGDTLWIYPYTPQKQKRIKAKKTAEAYISNDLKEAIDNCVWMTPEQWPFYSGARNRGQTTRGGSSTLLFDALDRQPVRYHGLQAASLARYVCRALLTGGCEP